MLLFTRAMLYYGRYRLRTRETGILSKMPFHLALLIETVISADGAELYSHMEEN